MHTCRTGLYFFSISIYPFILIYFSFSFSFGFVLELELFIFSALPLPSLIHSFVIMRHLKSNAFIPAFHIEPFVGFGAVEYCL